MSDKIQIYNTHGVAQEFENCLRAEKYVKHDDHIAEVKDWEAIADNYSKIISDSSDEIETLQARNANLESIASRLAKYPEGTAKGDKAYSDWHKYLEAKDG